MGTDTFAKTLLIITPSRSVQSPLLRGKMKHKWRKLPHKVATGIPYKMRQVCIKPSSKKDSGERKAFCLCESPHECMVTTLGCRNVAQALC